MQKSISTGPLTIRVVAEALKFSQKALKNVAKVLKIVAFNAFAANGAGKAILRSWSI